MRPSYDKDEGATVVETVYDNPDLTTWSSAGNIDSATATSFQMEPFNIGGKRRPDSGDITIGATYILTLSGVVDNAGYEIRNGAGGPLITTTEGVFKFVAENDYFYIRVPSSGGAGSSFSYTTLKLEEITPVFLNDTSKDSGIPLTPTKQLTENGITSTVFLLYDFREDSEVVNIGDHRYIIGADNHNYSLTCSTGGTTHTSPPSVVTADIGSTVAEDGGTVVWDVDHYYNNIATATTNYLTHILNEPVGVNNLMHSGDISNVAWQKFNALVSGTTLIPTVTNIAHTVFQGTSIISGTDYVMWFDGEASGFRFAQIAGSAGFTTTDFVTFDLLTGVYQLNGAITDADVTMERIGDLYRCSLHLQAISTVTGQMALGIVESLTSGRLTAFAGDAVSGIDFTRLQLEPTAFIPTSYIPTTTGSVQRNSTSFPVTPTPAEFLRLRFADVVSQTYLSSGTIEVSYDGTTLTWTDGTNAMTHVVAMVPGDFATVEEATGKLYYNGILVDTNGSYSPTWGEIALGNAVDYTFDDELDPLDSTWSQP
jgi:hypothetical protein